MSANVGVVQFVNDAAGRRSSLAQGSAVSSVGYGYDPAGRLATLGHELAGIDYDQTLAFTYNPASQVQTRSGTNGAYAWTSSGTYVRGYAANGLNQYPGATSTGASPVSYSYDANGTSPPTAAVPTSTTRRTA